MLIHYKINLKLSRQVQLFQIMKLRNYSKKQLLLFFNDVPKNLRGSGYKNTCYDPKFQKRYNIEIEFTNRNRTKGVHR